MSLTRNNLLILPLEYSEVFDERGKLIAKHVGTSELIYAAVAMLSFDDSSAAEAIIDSCGLVPEEIIWWLEDILTSHCNLFDHVRTFHNGQDLDEVVYEDATDTLYVSSTARPLLRSRHGLAPSRRRLPSY